MYKLILQHEDGIRTNADRKMVNCPTKFLAITKACRQTHAETRLLLYSINTFVMDWNNPLAALARRRYAQRNHFH